MHTSDHQFAARLFDLCYKELLPKMLHRTADFYIVSQYVSQLYRHPLLPDSRYRLQQQSIRRLAFVPPYSVFCSISFRCGGLSIERNQKPLAPEITLAVTHHDRQKQVEVKRSSRVNPHEIRLFSGCPYAVVKQGTKKFTKK